MDIDIEAAVPHVKNHLSDSVVNGTGGTDTVSLDSSKLDWTVAPRFEVGYRLPAGFGEIAVAYRFVVSQGTETIIGPDAPAPQRSRLDLNVADLDYISREFFTEQWPYCHMKWRFGLRYADAYFDSTAVEPFDVAAAGSGNFEQRESNNYWGIGPHWGVELAREFGTSGVKLVGAVDGAILLGRLNQNFFEASTTLDANGQPLTGNTHEAKSQSVPMVNCFVGLSWQPTWSPTSQLSVGYQYEYWWNVGRDSDTTSRGELSDQGIVLRAEFKF